MSKDSNFDAKTICYECDEPEKVAGIRILQVETSLNGTYFKPVAYCGHNQQAFFPLSIGGSSLEDVCREARQFAREALPKRRVEYRELYNIHERQLPKANPPPEWKRKDTRRKYLNNSEKSE